MNLKEFILITHKDSDFLVRPHIFCKDGFTMSVQGSSSHYCSPRSTQKIYGTMEIGFPSKRVNSILQYRDGNVITTESLY